MINKKQSWHKLWDEEIRAEWEERNGEWVLVGLEQTRKEKIGQGDDGAERGKLQRLLDKYQKGELVNWRKEIAYDLEVTGRGTGFQRAVWREIDRIPAEESVTYKQIAQKIGRPRAYRAVGSAVGKNPLPIIVPCHRVLATNNRLGGFAWGTEMKKRLLGNEGWEIIGRTVERK